MFSLTTLLAVVIAIALLAFGYQAAGALGSIGIFLIALSIIELWSARTANQHARLVTGKDDPSLPPWTRDWWLALNLGLWLMVIGALWQLE